MTPTRRTLLRGLGSSLAVAGLAGCVADGPGGSDGTTTPTTERTTPPPTTRDDSGPHPVTTTGGDGHGPMGMPGDRKPTKTFTLGSRSNVDFAGHHREWPVDVWNGAGESRRIAVTVERGGQTVLSKVVTLGAKRYVSIVVNEPDDYAVTMGVAGKSKRTLSLDRGGFDCNARTTTAVVLPDGDVKWQTVSTMMGCLGARIAEEGATFSAEDGTCMSGDAGPGASIAYADEAVTVEGRIRVPDPCHGAKLAAARIDSTTLTVVAEATDPKPSQSCVQCVGVVPYTATIPLANDYPETTRVVHVSGGDRTTVARESRR